MNKTEKVDLGKEINECFKKAKVAIFTNYKGVSANEMNEFRKSVRLAGGEVKVLKNNVARKSVVDGFSDDMRSLLDETVGPTAVAFAYKDAAQVAKSVHTFAKDHEALEIKPSILGAKKILAAEVEQLAKLPSREVMLATLLGTLNAPAQSFVSVLAAVPRSFVTVLDAIAKKKGQ